MPRARVVVLMLLSLMLRGPASSAQDAAPVSTSRPTDPAACQVTPRAIPLYEALALLPAGTPSPDEDPPDPPATVPTGQPADEATVAAVSATMREYTACLNAGDYRRLFALVTDDYLRGFFATVAEIANAFRAPPALAVLTFTAGSPLPRAEQVWITVESIENVRVLADGRVGAIVVVRDPTRDPEISTGVALFEQVEGRWLLAGGLELPTAAIVGALQP